MALFLFLQKIYKNQLFSFWWQKLLSKSGIKQQSMVTPPADEKVNDLLNQKHDQWVYRRMPLKLLFAAIRTTAKKRGILYFIPLCNISSKVVGKENFHIIQNLSCCDEGSDQSDQRASNQQTFLHHVLHYYWHYCTVH